MKGRGMLERFRVGMKCDDDRTNDSRSREKHCQQQQSTAQKHRRKKPVFALTKPVPKHPHKPKKGNSSERHEMHRERDIQQAIVEPRSRLEGISGQRNANKRECYEQEHRKQNACDGGGSWSSQLGVCEPLLARIHRRSLLPE